MDNEPHESLREGLNPRGFRKWIAVSLLIGVTTLPTLILWPNNPPQIPGLFDRTAGFEVLHRRSFRHQPFETRSRTVSQPSRMWTFFESTLPQLCFATFGGLVAVVLYYPRSGFRRFAIFCGPLIGAGAVFSLVVYLTARSEVYSIEIFLAALAGSIPGIAMYVWLVSRKANQLALAMAKPAILYIEREEIHSLYYVEFRDPDETITTPPDHDYESSFRD